MVISCHMQSGVLIHALGPEPVVPNASPVNHHIRFKFFYVVGACSASPPPAVTRLTVYCWLHITGAEGKAVDAARNIYRINGASTLLDVVSLRFERLQPMGRIWRKPVYNKRVVFCRFMADIYVILRLPFRIGEP